MPRDRRRSRSLDPGADQPDLERGQVLSARGPCAGARERATTPRSRSPSAIGASGSAPPTKSRLFQRFQRLNPGTPTSRAPGSASPSRRRSSIARGPHLGGERARTRGRPSRSSCRPPRRKPATAAELRSTADARAARPYSWSTTTRSSRAASRGGWDAGIDWCTSTRGAEALDIAAHPSSRRASCSTSCSRTSAATTSCASSATPPPRPPFRS